MLGLLPAVAGMLVVRAKAKVFAAPFTALFVHMRAAMVGGETMLMPVDILPVLILLPLFYVEVVLLLCPGLIIFLPFPVMVEGSRVIPAVSEMLLAFFLLLTRVPVLWPLAPLLVSFFLVMHVTFSLNGKRSVGWHPVAFFRRFRRTEKHLARYVPDFSLRVGVE
jgi:hypothetical protein